MVFFLIIASYIYYQHKPLNETLFTNKQSKIIKDTPLEEESIDVEKFSHNTYEQKTTQKHSISETSNLIEKNKLQIEEELYTEMSEETEEIYETLIPENYEETLEEAHTAFATLDDESSQARTQLSEEEAQIQEDASSIEIEDDAQS